MVKKKYFTIKYFYPNKKTKYGYRYKRIKAGNISGASSKADKLEKRSKGRNKIEVYDIFRGK